MQPPRAQAPPRLRTSVDCAPLGFDEIRSRLSFHEYALWRVCKAMTKDQGRDSAESDGLPSDVRTSRVPLVLPHFQNVDILYS